jgi:hypothetical protein
MARVIFECIKVVLKKVSFNSDLFSKELKKTSKDCCLTRLQS